MPLEPAETRPRSNFPESRVAISVRAIFCQREGGRKGGKLFAQKILASCPNFYETVEKKRGPYDAIM